MQTRESVATANCRQAERETGRHRTIDRQSDRPREL